MVATAHYYFKNNLNKDRISYAFVKEATCRKMPYVNKSRYVTILKPEVYSPTEVPTFILEIILMLSCLL